MLCITGEKNNKRVTWINFIDSSRGEVRIFDLVHPDFFSERCSYMQYLLWDGV